MPYWPSERKNELEADNWLQSTQKSIEETSARIGEALDPYKSTLGSAMPDMATLSPWHTPETSSVETPGIVAPANSAVSPGLGVASTAPRPFPSWRSLRPWAPPDEPEAPSPGARSATGTPMAMPTGAPPQTGDLRAYTRAKAVSLGIDPDIAERVAMSEGGFDDPVRQSDVVYQGQREQSYGPYQLNVTGGMGTTAIQRGHDPRDPANIYRNIDFALENAAQGGWGPFHGAARVGIGSRQGIGVTAPGPAPRPGLTTPPQAEQTPAAQRQALTGITPPQFGLGDADAESICGPVLAMAFARANGRNPSISEAKQLATQHGGWTNAEGMGGPEKMAATLRAMNIPATYKPGALNIETIRRETQNGNPVGINTRGHYFVVEGVDAQGRLDLGNSAKALKASGGRQWFRPEEIAGLGMGAPTGVIYKDSPSSPEPSVAVKVTKMPPAAPIAAPTAAASQPAAAVPPSPPPAVGPTTAGGGSPDEVTVQMPNSTQTMRVPRQMVGEGPGLYAPSKGWQIVGEGPVGATSPLDDARVGPQAQQPMSYRQPLDGAPEMLPGDGGTAPLPPPIVGPGDGGTVPTPKAPPVRDDYRTGPMSPESPNPHTYGSGAATGAYDVQGTTPYSAPDQGIATASTPSPVRDDYRTVPGYTVNGVSPGGSGTPDAAGATPPLVAQPAPIPGPDQSPQGTPTTYQPPTYGPALSETTAPAPPPRLDKFEAARNLGSAAWENVLKPAIETLDAANEWRINSPLGNLSLQGAGREIAGTEQLTVEFGEDHARLETLIERVRKGDQSAIPEMNALAASLNSRMQVERPYRETLLEAGERNPSKLAETAGGVAEAVVATALAPGLSAGPVRNIAAAALDPVGQAVGTGVEAAGRGIAAAPGLVQRAGRALSATPTPVAQADDGVQMLGSGVVPRGGAPKPAELTLSPPQMLALSTEIVRTHTASGGSTFHPTRGNLVGQPLYSVSLYPELGEVFDAAPTPQQIETFIKKRRSVLADDRLSVGTWHNKRTDKNPSGDNKHYLDISATLPDRAQAERLGQGYNQFSIYGLDGTGDIVTGGDGTVPRVLPPVSTRLPLQGEADAAMRGRLGEQARMSAEGRSPEWWEREFGNDPKAMAEAERTARPLEQALSASAERSPDGLAHLSGPELAPFMQFRSPSLRELGSGIGKPMGTDDTRRLGEYGIAKGWGEWYRIFGQRLSEILPGVSPDEGTALFSHYSSQLSPQQALDASHATAIAARDTNGFAGMTPEQAHATVFAVMDRVGITKPSISASDVGGAKKLYDAGFKVQSDDSWKTATFQGALEQGQDPTRPDVGYTGDVQAQRVHGYKAYHPPAADVKAAKAAGQTAPLDWQNRTMSDEGAWQYMGGVGRWIAKELNVPPSDLQAAIWVIGQRGVVPLNSNTVSQFRALNSTHPIFAEEAAARVAGEQVARDAGAKSKSAIKKAGDVAANDAPMLKEWRDAADDIKAGRSNIGDVFDGLDEIGVFDLKDPAALDQIMQAPSYRNAQDAWQRGGYAQMPYPGATPMTEGLRYESHVTRPWMRAGPEQGAMSPLHARALEEAPTVTSTGGTIPSTPERRVPGLMMPHVVVDVGDTTSSAISFPTMHARSAAALAQRMADDGEAVLLRRAPALGDAGNGVQITIDGVAAPGLKTSQEAIRQIGAELGAEVHWDGRQVRLFLDDLGQEDAEQRVLDLYDRVQSQGINADAIKVGTTYVERFDPSRASSAGVASAATGAPVRATPRDVELSERIHASLRPDGAGAAVGRSGSDAVPGRRPGAEVRPGRSQEAVPEVGSGLIPGLRAPAYNAAQGGVMGAVSEDLQAQQEGREVDPGERMRRALVGGGLAVAAGSRAGRRVAGQVGSGVVPGQPRKAYEYRTPGDPSSGLREIKPGGPRYDAKVQEADRRTAVGQASVARVAHKDAVTARARAEALAARRPDDAEAQQGLMDAIAHEERAQDTLNAAREWEQMVRTGDRTLGSGVVTEPSGSPHVYSPEPPTGVQRRYHGTAGAFDAADPSKFAEDGLYGPGYYTTSDPRVAGSYAGSRGTDASGPNIRAVDVPPGVNMFDVDAPLTSETLTRVETAIQAIARENPDDIDEALLAAVQRIATAVERRSAVPGGMPIHADALISEIYQVAKDAGVSKRLATEVLERAGFDGIAHTGGKRVPMLDDSMNPIEHDVSVIFPGSVNKVRNAFSGTKGGGYVPFDPASAAAGGAAGAMSEDEEGAGDPLRTAGGMAVAGVLGRKFPNVAKWAASQKAKNVAEMTAKGIAPASKLEIVRGTTATVGYGSMLGPGTATFQLAVGLMQPVWALPKESIRAGVRAIQTRNLSALREPAAAAGGAVIATRKVGDAIWDVIRARGAYAPNPDSPMLSQKIADPFGRELMQALETPGRVWSSLPDAIFGTYTQHMVEARRAAQLATDAGHTGEKWQEWVDLYLKEAERVRTTGSSAVGAGTADVIATGATAAEKAAMRRELGTIGRAVQKVARGGDAPVVGNFLSPFFKGQWNAFLQQAERSPAGFVMNTQPTKFDKVYDAVVGSAAIFALAEASRQGAVTVNGSGPTNQNERQAWIDDGNRPYSMRIGDVFIPNRLFGFGEGLLNAVGEANDHLKYKKPDADTRALSGDALARIGKLLKQQPYANGYATIADTIQFGPAAAAADIATRFTPGGATLRAIGTAGDTAERTIDRGAGVPLETEAYQRWQQGTGQRQDLPVAQDIFGRPKENPQQGVAAFFSRLGYAKDDPIISRFQEAGVTIGDPSKDITDAGLTVKLSPNETRRWDTLRGEHIITQTQRLIDNGALDRMPPDVRAKQLEAIKVAAAKQAVARLKAELGPEWSRRMRAAAMKPAS